MRYLLILLFIASCSSNESELTINASTLPNQLDLVQGERVIKNLDFNNDLSTLSSDWYEISGLGSRNIVLFYKQGDQIEVELDKDGNLISLSGGTEQKNYETYETYRKESLSRLVQSVRREISKTKDPKIKDSLTAIEIRNYEIHLKELMSFSKKELNNSLVLAYASQRWILEGYQYYIAETQSEFQETYPNTFALKRMEERIKTLKTTAIGAQLENFNYKNIDGEVSPMIAHVDTRLKLLDFWASWCPPCRQDSKYLRQLHSKYQESDLNIRSISLDTRQERWFKAIKEDQRNWVNLNAEKGLNASSIEQLGIKALPFNILLDKDNRIIAKNIHGKSLTQFIDRYLANQRIE
ncbi:TlpA family protein disulfide reductase [Flavobacteriaceae bacterium]|nr:TlpA family protein disulfide reductase [Flavobacteriaceae bacterium]